MKTLQEVFSDNFARDDLEGAKRWIRKWCREMDQHIPDHEPNETYGYTQRAMSGHVSDYLEGKDGTEPDSYNMSGISYLSTKFGPSLFWAC